MKSLKDFFSIVDVHMVLVTILSLTLTYICIRFHLQADLPSGFVGVAIVFPVVFSINAAYKRREQALGYFADIKAHTVSLYYAHRDWIPKTDPAVQLQKKFKDISLETFHKIHIYLEGAHPEVRAQLFDVYRQFSELSKLNEDMRNANVPANEISRANQYLRSMIIGFEKMRNIRLYRTPLALRAYSRIFLNASPIIFGPFFANISLKHYAAIGYVFAVLYSIVLLSLDHIQEDLENPFDGIGDDDLHLEIREEYEMIMSEE